MVRSPNPLWFGLILCGKSNNSIRLLEKGNSQGRRGAPEHCLDPGDGAGAMWAASPRPPRARLSHPKLFVPSLAPDEPPGCHSLCSSLSHLGLSKRPRGEGFCILLPVPTVEGLDIYLY